MLGYLYISHRAKTDVDFPVNASLSGRLLYSLAQNAACLNSGDRRLCICKLDDIWQLHRSSYETRITAKSNPYLLDMISKELGADLGRGQWFILLDLSGEGHPFVPESFDDLHSWCDSAGLDRSFIGIVSQNRALAAEYNARYSRSPSKISFFIYDWIIHVLARMLASEPSLFREQFRFSRHDKINLEAASVEMPFLCLNATPRPLRVAALAALRAMGILSRTRWSLLCESSGKDHASESAVSAFCRSLGMERDLGDHSRELLRAGEKRIDQLIVQNSNQLVWSIDYDSYSRTCVSIVTETDFSSGQIVRVTEKTIKAFAMGRITIVFGNPYSLALVRQLGFRTFHPIIDETYDDICDPANRFRAVCEQILVLNNRLIADFYGVIRDCASVANYNREHAINGGLFNAYEHNIETPFLNELQSKLIPLDQI